MSDVSLRPSAIGRHFLFILTLLSFAIGAVGTTAAQERQRGGGRAIGAQAPRGPNQFRPGGFNRPQFGANGPRQPGAFNRPGFNRAGFNRPGFNRPGFNRGGPFGVARNGLPRRPMIGERGFTGVPARGETRFLSNEMMFHVGPNVSAQAVDDALRRAGVTSLGSQNLSITGGRLYRLQINDGRQVADVVRSLEQQNIGTAQPNYVYRAQEDTHALPHGDPSQYAVTKMRLVETHRIATGKNVLVAVIDSQIDMAHPDLAGAIVGEFNATGNREKPDSHGTGMSGAIAAHQRLLGVAPDAKILAIHAFSPDAQASAQATSQHILAGIDWAIQKGARIINMSFAGPYDPMLQLALKKAHDKGIVLIAAAGNAGPQSPPLYPAADENVIAVTATDQNDKLLAQANQGPHIALAAPGVDILEPAPNSSYQLTTGTSVAAAHVTGVAALIIEREPNIDDATLTKLLTSTAKDLGPQGRDDQFGYGLVDPYRALSTPEAQIAGGEPRAPAVQAVTMKPLPRQAQNASGGPVVMASDKVAQANVPSPSQVAPRPVPVPPSASGVAPPDNEAEREASRAAAVKRRQVCRQDAASRQMRGPDLQDFVNVCVAEARVACLKQAVAQKVRGPARRDFLNGCMAGEVPGAERVDAR